MHQHAQVFKFLSIDFLGGLGIEISAKKPPQSLFAQAKEFMKHKSGDISKESLVTEFIKQLNYSATEIQEI